MMSWPWTVWPITTSLVMPGLSAAICSYSSLRPPSPPYCRNTVKPASACSVAASATVWPSTSLGSSSTPASLSSAACSALSTTSTSACVPLARFTLISWGSTPAARSVPSSPRSMVPWNTSRWSLPATAGAEGGGDAPREGAAAAAGTAPSAPTSTPAATTADNFVLMATPWAKLAVRVTLASERRPERRDGLLGRAHSHVEDECAFEEQVGVERPGEADAAVDLDARARGPVRGPGGDDAGG